MFDISRILVKPKNSNLLEEDIDILIKSSLFRVKIMGDFRGPLCSVDSLSYGSSSSEEE